MKLPRKKQERDECVKRMLNLEFERGVTEGIERQKENSKLGAERLKAKIELVRAVAQGFDALSHAIQDGTIAGRYL